MDQLIFGAYGILLLLGAYFGGRAGSRVSIIMGIVSGGVVLAETYYLGIQPRTALIHLSIFNGFLTLIFSMRLLKTRRFMPSGVLFSVALVVFVYTLRRLWAS